jgi:hypothetical protein
MALVLLVIFYAASAAALALAVRTLRGPTSLAVALLVSTLPLAFTFDGFRPGLTLAPTPVLARVAPWHDERLIAQVANEASLDNPLLLDPMSQMVPWDLAARESILFNASQGGGAALLGNGQSAALFPVDAIGRLIPPFRAVTYRQAARLLVAAWGMFLLARLLGYGEIAGAVSAAVFVGSGFLQLWRLHPHSNVAAVAPWIAAAAILLLRSPGPRTGALLAITGAAAVFGGHPETLLHVLLFTIVAAPLLATPGQDAPPASSSAGRRLLAPASWGAFAAALAFLLAAPALLPLVENLTHSVEWTEFRGERRSYGALPLPASLERLAPVAALLAFGDPRRDTWDGPENLVEVGGAALGAPALLLALLAFAPHARGSSAWRADRSRLAVLLALGLIGVLVGAHAPLVTAPFTWVPLLRDTLLTRLGLWWVLAGSILAGAGAAAVVSGRVGASRAWASAAAVAAIVVLAQRGAPADEPARIAALELAPLLVLLPVVLGLRAPERGSATRFASGERWRLPTARILACGVLALAALVVPRGVLFARWIPVTPIEGFYPPTPSTALVAGRLAALPDHGWRVAGTVAALVPHAAAFYGFDEIRAYDPVTFAPYAKFLAAVGDPPRHGWIRIDRLNGPALDYLGVRFLFDHPKAVRQEPSTLLHRGKDGVVWERHSALPRAFFPRTVRAERDPDTALAAARSLTDFVQTAIVAADAAESRANADAEVLELAVGRGEISVRTDASDDALLATSQPAIPGWRLTVDGVAAPERVRRVNGAFLGAVVPRGVHDVELRYRPRSWATGLVLAAIGSIAAATALVRAGRRRRRAA